jgi:hypothetical protein
MSHNNKTYNGLPLCLLKMVKSKRVIPPFKVRVSYSTRYRSLVEHKGAPRIVSRLVDFKKMRLRNDGL